MSIKPEPTYEMDTRLMRTLYHLLNERSVSGAAKVLGISQPSASQALRRLRDLIGDPLLVRSGANMVCTDHGIQVLKKITNILGELDGILHGQSHFDPAKSGRKVTVFAANWFGRFLVPRIVKSIRAQGPRMQVEFRPMTSEAQLMQDLNEGEIDLAIGDWPNPPANMHYASLLKTEIACIVRPQHPIARQQSISLAEYLALDHLSPTPPRGMSISPISARLANLGVRRRVAVAVPEFSMVPEVLMANDLVFTTGKNLVNAWIRDYHFRILTAPAELGDVTLYMLWHERQHQSSYGQWLRSLVRLAVKEAQESQ